jgi:hypothetical protein
MPLILKLGTALVTLHPGKEPLVPIKHEAGWAPLLVWLLWRIDNFLDYARNQNTITQMTNTYISH